MSTPPSPTADSSEKPATGSRIAILAVGSALFMQFVDSTGLATALPTLAREFNASPVDLRLVLTTYMVVQALFLPACGWAADRFGARRVFMAAMIVFLIGSLLCGVSHSLPQLVAARAVQGLGGSMMMPVGRIIVVGSSPRHQLVQAMMWLGLPAMVGPVVGPPLAGLILQFGAWPWIFFVNIPIGLLGLLAVVKFVPRLEQPHPGRFDFVGFLIAMAAIAAVMTIAEAQGHNGWLQLAGLAVALPAAVLYVIHARRRMLSGGRPVLDLTLLRYRTLRASVVGGSFVRLGIGGAPYLMALLLQVGLGWTPLQAGSVTIASALGAVFSRPLGPTVIRRLGFRTMLIGSAVAVAVFGSLPALFGPNTPIALMMVLLAFSGFARAAQFSAANSMAYAEVPDDRISAASTLSSVVQQITLSLGITLAGLSLDIAHGTAPIKSGDFLLPFGVIGAMALVSAATYVNLPANAGAELSGQGRRGRR